MTENEEKMMMSLDTIIEQQNSKRKEQAVNRGKFRKVIRGGGRGRGGPPRGGGLTRGGGFQRGRGYAPGGKKSMSMSMGMGRQQQGGRPQKKYVEVNRAPKPQV